MSVSLVIVAEWDGHSIARYHENESPVHLDKHLAHAFSLPSCKGNWL